MECQVSCAVVTGWNSHAVPPNNSVVTLTAVICWTVCRPSNDVTVAHCVTTVAAKKSPNRSYVVNTLDTIVLPADVSEVIAADFYGWHERCCNIDMNVS